MWLTILYKMFWSGTVAVGFAILFNVHKKLLLSVFIISAMAGMIKFTAIHYETGFILAALMAASLAGFTSIPVARYKKTSPFVISIPAMIPMIPGYFGYEMLLGIMQLALNKPGINEMETLLNITHNALNMSFILGSLSIGVSLPWLLFREKGLQKMNISDKDTLV